MRSPPRDRAWWRPSSPPCSEPARADRAAQGQPDESVAFRIAFTALFQAAFAEFIDFRLPCHDVRSELDLEWTTCMHFSA